MPSETEAEPRAWFCNKCGSTGMATSRSEATVQHDVRNQKCQYSPAWGYTPAIPVEFIRSDELAALRSDASLGAALRAALATVPVSYELHVRRQLDEERRDLWRVVLNDAFGDDSENNATSALATALSERGKT